MQIINAKIFTMVGGEFIENGFVSINDGIITAVGDMSEFEDNFDDKLDAAGKILVPGFIDAHTHVGMWEDSLGFEGDDGNEDTDPSTPHLRAIDAVNPFDRCFDDALRAGITTVLICPGSANPIGGQGVLMKTYGTTTESRLVNEASVMKMALGENPKSTYHSKNQTPVTRMATAAIIREQLSKAMRYKKDLETGINDEDCDEPELDIKCEALLPVLDGDMKLHIHAHRADDIMTALRICKEFSLEPVIVHVTDGEIIKNELKNANVAALCGPVLCDRSKPELKNLSPRTAAVLSENDVLTAIITDHPVIPIEYLPICAALCVKNGMDYMKALEAITINPAKILGIDKNVGSVEVGKSADIAIFDGDPLNIMSKCEYVFVNGEMTVFA
ncbi:MAG: amidohydrolase [Ruminococcaceae bacterium]|nr:amidohydrolase [Oscillospiraceae bacterium]